MKTIFVLLFLVSCGGDTKFHYRDSVEIKSGFYKGKQGTVDEYLFGLYKVKFPGYEREWFLASSLKHYNWESTFSSGIKCFDVETNKQVHCDE